MSCCKCTVESPMISIDEANRLVQFIPSWTLNNREFPHRLTREFMFKNFKDGVKVKVSDIISEWDPFTLPIIAQANGVMIFQDLEEGVSTREIVDDSTGLSSNIVIDWKQQAKNQNLVPRVEIHDKGKNGNILTLENGSIASYELLSLIHI